MNRLVIAFSAIIFQYAVLVGTLSMADDANNSAPPGSSPATTQASKVDTPEIAEKETIAAMGKGDVGALIGRTLFDASDKSDHREDVKEALAKLAETPRKMSVLEVRQQGDCASVIVRNEPPLDHHSVEPDVFVKIDGRWLSPWDKPDDAQLTKQQWKDMGDVVDWGEKRCAELDPNGWPLKGYLSATQP